MAPMANQHAHKLRGIRGVDDELWEDVKDTAQEAGSDASSVTRDLWQWYVRRPGAELPDRPERPEK